MSTEAEIAKAAYWPAYSAAVRHAPSNRNGQGITSGDAEKAALAGYEAVLAAVEPLIRERLAQEVEAAYLGPDFGRQYDGRESPDAPLTNAYDEGLEHAARIIRGAS